MEAEAPTIGSGIPLQENSTPKADWSKQRQSYGSLDWVKPDAVTNKTAAQPTTKPAPQAATNPGSKNVTAPTKETDPREPTPKAVRPSQNPQNKLLRHRPMRVRQRTQAQSGLCG